MSRMPSPSSPPTPPTLSLVEQLAEMRGETEKRMAGHQDWMRRVEAKRVGPTLQDLMVLMQKILDELAALRQERLAS